MMILHAGAVKVDRNAIEMIPVPEETRTYTPLPYNKFIDIVLDGLFNFGYEVIEQEYAVSSDKSRGRHAPLRYGSQLFALLKLKHDHADFTTCLGLRSSYDKSLSNGMCLGNSVFICDNLAFFSDMMEFRKHTNGMLNDDERSLYTRLATLLGSVPALIEHQDNQLQAFRAIEITPQMAHDFVVRAALNGVYASDKILRVLSEFNNPKHSEFSDPTLWSMINAVTEVLKGSNIFELQDRTKRLYDLAKDVSYA